jgi:hypothetical protein
MKTHDFAKELRRLAEAMEAAPNMAIERLSFTKRETLPFSSDQMAVSLSTLVELSRVDKRQWTRFITELGFPIEIRPRDASRDILGKLLNYLESNESARQKLKTKAATKGSQASPELMKALNSLLK